MSFNINEFRAGLGLGGLRTNLFDVVITNPVVSVADGVLPLRCESAALPEDTLNRKEVFYFGRHIKLPGARSYQDWNVTVIEDEDFVVRDALQAWSSHINAHEGNVNRLPTAQTTLYKSVADVRMWSQTGQLLTTRQLIGVWPQYIAPIQGDWGNDEIVRYQVTFCYDYWVPTTGGQDIEV